MLKYLIPLVVFFTLVVLFVFGLQNDPKLVPSPFIGKPLPAISLPELADPDKTVTSEDLKGDITLLNVWATWCIPCRQEHPVLLKLSGSEEIRIIGLNYKDNREQALDWLKNLGNPYDTVLFDEDGTAGIDLGVYGVPETFVLDRNAVVRHKHVGPLTEEDLADSIMPVINDLKSR